MGHAYEFLTTDVLTRYARVFGKDAFFCTGSNEHGQKVASSAAKMNRTPIDHCHVYVNAFKVLNQRLVVNQTFIKEPLIHIMKRLLVDYGKCVLIKVIFI